MFTARYERNVYLQFKSKLDFKGFILRNTIIIMKLCVGIHIARKNITRGQKYAGRSLGPCPEGTDGTGHGLTPASSLSRWCTRMQLEWK